MTNHYIRCPERYVTSEFLEALKIPTQLKKYILDSRSVKKLINEIMLEIIEEQYIYFKNFYSINDIEFSKIVLKTFTKAKDLNEYKDYLGKTLKDNLELFQKDESEKNVEANVVHISKNKIDYFYKESSTEFLSILDEFYNNDNRLDATEFYKLIGKFELMNEITNDIYFEQLLTSGNKVIEKMNNQNR